MEQVRNGSKREKIKLIRYLVFYLGKDGHVVSFKKIYDEN